MQPLVSAVVTTRNEEAVLEALLVSLRAQHYPGLEVLVVDNASTDATKAIARRYADLTLDAGPERSAQRNVGALRARGAYLLFLDADMVLTPGVVAECVAAVATDPGLKALIIPEESFGTGFWARCKILERSCYAGDRSVEAARFFERAAFLEVGGYDPALTGVEDWDLSRRVARGHRTGRIRAVVRHDEGALSLSETVRKKYYYGQTFSSYLVRHGGAAVAQTNLVARPAYFRHWRRLVHQPELLAGLLVMRSLETAAAGAGCLEGIVRAWHRQRRAPVRT